MTDTEHTTYGSYEDKRLSIEQVCIFDNFNVLLSKFVSTKMIMHNKIED